MPIQPSYPSAIRERILSHVAALPSIVLRDLVELTAGSPRQIRFSS